jgi:hypothetical protein
MALPTRGFENLATDIVAAGARVDAALQAPDPNVSADLLLGCAMQMQRLADRVRQAADVSDLQSRRPIGRAV